MKTTHTPTPWRYGLKVSKRPAWEKILSGPIHVATVVQCDSSPIRVLNDTPKSQAEAEANAAFIVRACNSHAQLVAALEKLIDHASETYPHFESPRGQADIAQARAALAAAQP